MAIIRPDDTESDGSESSDGDYESSDGDPESDDENPAFPDDEHTTSADEDTSSGDGHSVVSHGGDSSDKDTSSDDVGKPVKKRAKTVSSPQPISRSSNAKPP